MTSERRAVGLLILLAALLLAVVIPATFGPGLAGTPSRAAFPEPPPVGSCVVRPEMTVVSCDQPHHLEITKAWAMTAESRPQPVVDADCSTTAQAYVGLPLDETPVMLWYQPIVSYQTSSVMAPDEQRIGGRGWTACAIAPSLGGTSVGSIRNLQEPRDRPGGFGSCVQVRAEEFIVGAEVSCTAMHDGEILAWAWQFVPDDPAAGLSELELGFPLPDEDELRTLCHELAADLLETDDPDVKGQLEVALDFVSEPNSLIQGPDDAGNFTEILGSSIRAICYIRTTGGRQLIDSVVGLGDKPVPFG